MSCVRSSIGRWELVYQLGAVVAEKSRDGSPKRLIFREGVLWMEFSKSQSGARWYLVVGMVGQATEERKSQDDGVFLPVGSGTKCTGGRKKSLGE